MKYTDVMIAEMRSIGNFDYNVATTFATKHGLSLRSVIAKCNALQIPYQAKDPKARTAKSPASVKRAKKDVVVSISESLGQTLPSLDKMTVEDLLKLEVAFA